jgi:hypothetical protein
MRRLGRAGVSKAIERPCTAGSIVAQPRQRQAAGEWRTVDLHFDGEANEGLLTLRRESPRHRGLRHPPNHLLHRAARRSDAAATHITAACG